TNTRGVASRNKNNKRWKPKSFFSRKALLFILPFAILAGFLIYHSFALTEITVKGRVTVNGVGVKDVYIDGCSLNVAGYGVAAITDANGDFSVLLHPSTNQGYCVRIFWTDYLPGTNVAVKHNKAILGNPTWPPTTVNRTANLQAGRYEYQIAGVNCYHAGTNNNCNPNGPEQNWDRGSDTGFTFAFTSPTPPPPPPPPPSGYCPLTQVGIPPDCITPGTQNSSGEFIIKCTFDHSAMDDPIVHPNAPGTSHMHDFYGLKGVTANPLSLTGTSTTCANPGDTAAYWQPTLLINGTPIKPSLLRAYYQGTNHTHTFPPGFQATAGNPHATSPQSDTIAYWGCGSGSSHPKQTTVPQCASGEGLTLHIKMNDCWTGNILPANTDYTAELASDGQSAGDGKCPVGFPYHIPAVILDVTWDARPNPATVSLSCGGQNCAHGDFNFGWQPAAFESLMARCLRNATNCGSVTK
ncbi:MAG: DUF1996 domain-containing protein, partial [Candidatus Saccharimonadales bacterium]